MRAWEVWGSSSHPWGGATCLELLGYVVADDEDEAERLGRLVAERQNGEAWTRSIRYLHVRERNA